MSRSIEHLNQLASRAAETVGGGETLDLWVPAESVLVFELELPSVSRRKLREMLPWMLEDQLLGAPEDFEFVLGPATGDANLVYAIPRASLSRWLMLAESAGVTPARMAPDYLALPWEEGRWTVYTDAGRMLVRSGPHSGFATDLEFGWQQLELLLGQCAEPPRLSHLQSGEAQIPANFTDRLDSQTGAINWAFTELPASINLLPERLKPRKSASWRRWWPAGACAGLFVVLGLTYLLVHSWVWQRDIAVLETAVAETYESLFAEPPPADIAALRDRAQTQMALLEHQYIQMQTTPMAELSALDPVLSGCPDCALSSLAQTDKGLVLELRQTPAITNRLAGLPAWQFDWQPSDREGFSRLQMEASP